MVGIDGISPEVSRGRGRWVVILAITFGVLATGYDVFSGDLSPFERELATISGRLRPRKPVPRMTTERLVELGRLATPDQRGRLLRWMLARKADMRSALRRVPFDGARLNGAKLARPALADRLKSASFVEAYTSEDYQAGRGVFTAWLAGAKLKGAKLERVDLHGANLQKADLRAASLRGANLSGAVLNGADLRGADLTGADFRRTRLAGARLDGVRQEGTKWQGATLALARGRDPAAVSSGKPDADSLAFFENRVRPLLIARCVKCHGPKKAEGGLRLDSQQGLLRGGDGGGVVVPGDPARSRLMKAVRREGEVKMPPETKLGRLEIADLQRWVRNGAAWPQGMMLADGGPRLRGGPITEAERGFWSFQPVRDPKPPHADGPGLRNDIDRFVQNRLKLAGLDAAPEADRRTLIRRATFDLTGLPPTPADVRAFVSDKKPGAFRRVVDRLLESPQYGVRWGRHWLDVVRYADTAGETADFPTPLSYKYRNWVIDAFNDDLPYDRFLLHQLAGDLVAEANKSLGDDDYRRLRIATGFVAISRRFGFDSENYHNLTIQDTIDTLGQAVLGLSLGCARCHDHKYDPVNTEDYYSWYGIFASTRYSFPGSEEKKKPYDLYPVVRADRVEQARMAYDVQRKKLDDEIRPLALQLSLLKIGLADADAARPAERKRTVTISPWRAYLVQRLLNQSERNRDNHQGFHVWHRDNLPMIGVNVSRVSLKVPGDVPPRTLVVHPAAKDGVGIAWRSPVSGRVRVSGRIIDRHDCGDSVRWHIDRLNRSGLQPLASAGNTRAGTTPISGEALESVAVKAGDYLQLVLVPQVNHGCDLTQVELEISEKGQDGETLRRWRLVPDVIDRFQVSNPHPGRGKWGEIWSFFRAQVDRGIGWANSNDLKPLVLELDGGKVALAAMSRRLEALERKRKALALREPVGLHYGVIDRDKPMDARIQIRGDRAKLGQPAVRRNLEILGGEKLTRPAESGRLELARWLTRDSNPLMPRVMVNRVWRGHFGRGLVATENDFGVRGEQPSHPELLDWLASRFREAKFSVKAIHRLIMESTAYRRSSRFDESAAAIDPNARLLWRFNLRRLSAEEIRDSILFVSGELDLSFGGAHPFPAEGSWGSFSQHAPFYGLYPSNRRSLFLMQQRLKRHPFLALFDGADPNVSTPRRELTTVPTQSLYLMNSEFVHRQSAALAKRVLERSASLSESLQRSWWMTLGRAASGRERAEAERFLLAYSESLGEAGGGRRHPAAWAALMRTLLTRNEFLFVD